MLGSDFDSFNESDLNAFTESDLGERGGGGAPIGNLFLVVDATSFGGKSGTHVWTYDLELAEWFDASTGLTGSKTNVHLFGYKNRLYCTGDFAGIKAYYPATQEWKDSADWAWASNSISGVNIHAQATTKNGTMVICPKNGLTTAITISSGGSDQIINFDGETFTAAGSLPDGAVQNEIVSGGGFIIMQTQANTLWYTSTGTSWTEETLLMPNNRSDRCAFQGNDSVMYGVGILNGFGNSGGTGVAIGGGGSWSFASSTIASMPRAQFQFPNRMGIDDNNDFYFGGIMEWDGAKFPEGIIKVTSGGSVISWDEGSTQIDNDIRANGFYNGLILVGMVDGGGDYGGQDFYDITNGGDDYQIALGVEVWQNNGTVRQIYAPGMDLI